MKVYYAHCVAIYNTPQEQRDVETLAKLGFDVLNPNIKEVQEAYPTKGMDMFKAMVEGCDVTAFRALPDGRIAAGVSKELEWAKAAGKPIIELPNAIAGRAMGVEATREYLRDCGQR